FPTRRSSDLLAVLGLGRAEHALDLDAVVVEGRGDTGERDDVRGHLVQLHGGAAVVLEAPGTGPGALLRRRAAAFRVVVPAGRERGAESEDAACDEQSATGEAGGSGIRHGSVCFRAYGSRRVRGRGPPGRKQP